MMPEDLGQTVKYMNMKVTWCIREIGWIGIYKPEDNVDLYWRNEISGILYSLFNETSRTVCYYRRCTCLGLQIGRTSYRVHSDK